MLLNDKHIDKRCKQGLVVPYEPTMLNPASLNIRYSGRYVEYDGEWKEMVEADSVIIKRGNFYLLDTVETFYFPHDLAGEIRLRSSWARKGLQHLLAVFFDPGFFGTATLEITTVAGEIRINKNDAIAQMILISLIEPCMISYKNRSGNYWGQRVPTRSKV